MTKRILLTAAVSAVAFLAAAAQPAFAQGTRCTGALTGVFDKVIVPENANCVLTDSIVRNDVIVLENAIFRSRRNVIGGNVQADRALVIEISSFMSGPNLIAGNVHARKLTGGIAICGSHVRGNVRVSDTAGNTLVVGGSLCESVGGGNTVYGSVQIDDNVVAGNGIDISGNTIGNNLQVDRNRSPQTRVLANVVGNTVRCRDNGADFVGGPNTARRREGQCF